MMETFQCREPSPRRPLWAASGTSSLPSPWKSCTCNHPGPFDGDIFIADMICVRLQYVTLLKMLTFHSSKDLHPKRPSTLFLNHNIGLVWLVRTLPLQSKLETREKSPGFKASNKLSHLLPLLTHHKIHLQIIVRQRWRQCKWWQGQQCCSQSQCCQKCNNMKCPPASQHSLQALPASILDFGPPGGRETLKQIMGLTLYQILCKLAVPYMCMQYCFWFFLPPHNWGESSTQSIGVWVVPASKLFWRP